LFTINDLLDLTRLESGNETILKESFNIRIAIENATNVYKKEAQRKGLDFSLDLESGPMDVVGDMKKIQTVVQNLIANACGCTHILLCHSHLPMA
jgi:signal transduction histidine kinase